MTEPTSPHSSERDLLVQEEQSASWRRGERVLVEALLIRHPWLQLEAESLLDLVFNEVLCREARGERPTLGEYKARFPHLSEHLAAHFAVHEALGSDLLIPAVGTLPTAKDSAAVPPWPRLPDYEILGELGRGGMGVVYKARHVKLKRTVAVKMILDGVMAGEDEVARFRREAEAVARLQHPNIVQIHEIGDSEGRPFFALEYVEGGSLAQRLMRGPLAARAAAELVRTLAQAVEAAHQQKVIHRDLKPANVLLAPASGRGSEQTRPEAGANEVPKIADFGLAKRLDDVRQTHSGALVGTPQYMAPEQAARRDAVGPPADIYALGAILYECVTGRPPFLGVDLMTVLEQVCHQDPVGLSRLQPGVPRDLETICLKCLRKEPEQRYLSASDLADDLRRFLTGEPIQARPTSAPERVWKWARRRPAVAALLAVTVLTIAIAFPLVTWKWLDADAARAKTVQALIDVEAALDKVQAQRANNLIVLAARDLQAYRTDRASAYLQECPEGLRRWDWHYLNRRLHDDLTTFQAEPVQGDCLAFNADGTLLATGGGKPFYLDEKGEVKVWRTASYRDPIVLRGHTGAVTRVVFLPDGRHLLSASTRADYNQLIKRVYEPQGDVFLWDVNNPTRPVRSFRLGFGSVATTADGTVVAAVCTDGRVRLWDTQTGQESFASDPQPGILNSVALDATGTRLAWTRSELSVILIPSSEVTVWDVPGNKKQATIRRDNQEVNQIVFSPDGKQLALAGSRAQPVSVWDATTGKLLQAPVGHTNTNHTVAFSPDGGRLFTAGQDQRIKIWATATGEEQATYRGHQSPVLGVAYAPRGAGPGPRLASIDESGQVKVWDAAASPGATLLTGHESPVVHLRFSSDGRLASVSPDGTARIWDVATKAELFKLPCRAEKVALSPDGRYVVTGGGDLEHLDRPGDLKLWDARTGRLVRPLKGHTLPVLGLAFSPDGRWLASTSGNPVPPGLVPGEVQLWDIEAGKEPEALVGVAGLVRDLTFSPDGRYLALASTDGLVQVFETAGRTEAFRCPGHEDWAYAVAFSPDSRRLAAGDRAGHVFVWDVASRKRLLAFHTGTGAITDLMYSPDGVRLATAGVDVTRGQEGVKLWDAELGQEILTLSGKFTVAFSPDGRYLASPSDTDLNAARDIQLWDAGPWRKHSQ